MDSTPTLFDGPFLRDEGIAAAEHQRTIAVQACDTAIRMLASLDDPFTAEDVRHMLGRYAAELDDISKVIGGRMRAAAVAGLIYTTGSTTIATRPTAHARRILEWWGKRDIKEIAA
jgi:hypothetical protein